MRFFSNPSQLMISFVDLISIVVSNTVLILFHARCIILALPGACVLFHFLLFLHFRYNIFPVV
jgi:hypothetical protein